MPTYSQILFHNLRRLQQALLEIPELNPHHLLGFRATNSDVAWRILDFLNHSFLLIIPYIPLPRVALLDDTSTVWIRLSQNISYSLRWPIPLTSDKPLTIRFLGMFICPQMHKRDVPYV